MWYGTDTGMQLSWQQVSRTIVVATNVVATSLITAKVMATAKFNNVSHFCVVTLGMCKGPHMHM